jgi:hypothetical protein
MTKPYIRTIIVAVLVLASTPGAFARDTRLQPNGKPPGRIRGPWRPGQ